MRRQLLNARALQFVPALAKLIGLNQAIVLQQIHYWLETSEHTYDARTWIYNTYDEWEAQFPYMSRRELVRTVKDLERLGLLVINRFNQNSWDRTNWYTIDYQAVDRLADRVNEVLIAYEAKKLNVVRARKQRGWRSR